MDWPGVLSPGLFENGRHPPARRLLMAGLSACTCSQRGHTLRKGRSLPCNIHHLRSLLSHCETLPCSFAVQQSAQSRGRDNCPLWKQLWRPPLSSILSNLKGLHILFISTLCVSSSSRPLYESHHIGRWVIVHTHCLSAAGCDCMRIANICILLHALQPQMHDLIASALSQ